jgi:hypothetical protein
MKKRFDGMVEEYTYKDFLESCIKGVLPYVK